MVPVGEQVYSYQHWYAGTGCWIPCRRAAGSLGEVGTYQEGENCVYTDMGEFPGCKLWIAGEGWDGRCISRHRRAPIWSVSRVKRAKIQYYMYKKGRGHTSCMAPACGLNKNQGRMSQ